MIVNNTFLNCVILKIPCHNIMCAIKKRHCYNAAYLITHCNNIKCDITNTLLRKTLNKTLL